MKRAFYEQQEPCPKTLVWELVNGSVGEVVISMPKGRGKQECLWGTYGCSKINCPSLFSLAFQELGSI